jgi:hypothetical protein
MSNKRKMVITAMVTLFVLGGTCFAFQGDSAFGWAVFGDDRIGTLVSDGEAADLVGGCGYWSYEQCGSSSNGCKIICYISCVFFCYPNENYINVNSTSNCGGSCGNYNCSPTSCGS